MEEELRLFIRACSEKQAELCKSSPSAKGEDRIARDGERGKGRSEQRTGRYLPAQNEEIRMDGWMDG